MGIFKTKEEKQLDEMVHRLEMNLSNNYKDNAQADLSDLEEAFNQMLEEGRLKEKVEKRYANILAEYQSKMKGYTHKDQKPYWT